MTEGSLLDEPIVTVAADELTDEVSEAGAPRTICVTGGTGRIILWENVPFTGSVHGETELTLMTGEATRPEPKKLNPSQKTINEESEIGSDVSKKTDKTKQIETKAAISSGTRKASVVGTLAEVMSVDTDGWDGLLASAFVRREGR